MKRIIAIIGILTILLSCCSCAAREQSGNLFDFCFEINGKTYKLAEKISTFTENGWTLPENLDTEKTITPGNLESTILELDSEDNWVNVEIFNYSDQDCLLKDCPIGRVTYHFEGDLKIVTAGNFSLEGKKKSDIIAKYGEPFSEAEYGSYTEIIYDKDPESGIYDRYTFRFDNESGQINYFDIIMFY